VKLPRLARLWWLLRQSLVTAYEDNCLAISKGAAFSALLSFFPVLTTLAAILVQVKARQVAQLISRFLFEVVPPGTEDLVLRTFAVRGERPGSLLVGATLLSLWAASGVVVSLMEGFNAVYKVPTSRPFLRQRAVSVLLVFSTAIPVLAASALILFGARTEWALMYWLGFSARGERIIGWVLLLGQFARYLVALGALVLGAALLYRLGPNRPQQWRNTWPGACLATFLWLLATSAFAWYVRNIADYNVMYGSVGAGIALIIWMYLLAVIALIGCAFNAENERLETTARSLAGA